MTLSSAAVLALLAQADPTPAWVDVLSAAAQVVLALSLLFLAGVVIAIALGLKKAYGRLRPALEGLRGGLDPVVRNAAAISENASYISGAVRQDVEALSRTVTATGERLDRAAAMAEQRLSDFNALLGVVQEEAEELFIGTASAARGLRAGAETLRRLRAGEAPGRPPAPGRDAREEEEDEGYRGLRTREDDGFDLTDDEITDEELEIRIARRDARPGRGGGAGPG